MRTIAKMALVWSMSGICGAGAQVTKPGVALPLDAVIGHLELKDATLVDGISQLTLQPIAQLHIGLEEVLRRKRSDPRDRSVQFSVDLEHITVRQALDALCKEDGRYTWSADGQSINLYPRATIGDESYLLNVTLNAITLDAVPDPEQGLTPLARLLPWQQIGYSGVGINGSYAEPWTATFRHITVRQFINRLAEHLGPRSSWDWQGGNDSRMFFFSRYGFRPI
jgi:hypothetical protein